MSRCVAAICALAALAVSACRAAPAGTHLDAPAVDGPVVPAASDDGFVDAVEGRLQIPETAEAPTAVEVQSIESPWGGAHPANRYASVFS